MHLGDGGPFSRTPSPSWHWFCHRCCSFSISHVDMGLGQARLQAPWSGDQAELESWPSSHCSHRTQAATPSWHPSLQCLGGIEGAGRTAWPRCTLGYPRVAQLPPPLAVPPRSGWQLSGAVGTSPRPRWLARWRVSPATSYEARGDGQSRHAASPPAPLPPLSLIKLQVNLPGSGPTPGTKRLPADPDLPPCTSVSVPGTARSPRSPSAHGAPSRQPSPLCGLQGPGLSSTTPGMLPWPQGLACTHQLAEGPGDGGAHRDVAEHLKHPRALRGQVGKAIGLPGGTENPASSPAAAAPGQPLRSAGTGAWLGLCRARRRGPELGSISPDIRNSTCLPQHTAKPPQAPVCSWLGPSTWCFQPCREFPSPCCKKSRFGHGHTDPLEPGSPSKEGTGHPSITRPYKGCRRNQGILLSEPCFLQPRTFGGLQGHPVPL